MNTYKIVSFRWMLYCIYLYMYCIILLVVSCYYIIVLFDKKERRREIDRKRERDIFSKNQSNGEYTLVILYP